MAVFSRSSRFRDSKSKGLFLPHLIYLVERLYFLHSRTGRNEIYKVNSTRVCSVKNFEKPYMPEFKNDNPIFFKYNTKQVHEKSTPRTKIQTKIVKRS